MSQNVLWSPSEKWKVESNLTSFQHWLEELKSLSFTEYQELWNWSINNLEEFWISIYQFFEIQGDGEVKSVMDSHSMPGIRWFDGIRLNYSEHLCRHRTDQRPALHFFNEQGYHAISWKQLEHQVRIVRDYLMAKKVGKGDRVVAYLPNTPEAISAFIAVNSLGAIWSCCSPDFGVETVIERFQQIEPKVFIAADGYRYAGKLFDRRNAVISIRKGLPTVTDALLFEYVDKACQIESFDSWTSLQNNSPSPLIFTRVDFNDPIWILYSSGTTGKPKAITHSHGGVLLEHYKYMAFHNDVRAGENFFWFSTTGWMMWNFLQASLLVGAVPVLYDGSPGYPNLEVLWEMAASLPIHHFGTSAPYLTACMKQGLMVGANYDMQALRSIGSTGAPLPPEAFRWVYESISREVWLCSMSGGTDVCTAFVGGNPWLPVYEGYIQSRALGCALFAYDEQGNHINNSLGEMVIEKPMPSMPIYFWNDKDGERYRSSYFDTYPGKWRHGDWINIMDNGSLIIHGRSDATLNRKGIRIGTAEIYNVLNKFDAIKDALILNIELEGGDDIMPLYVVLKEGQALSDSLMSDIKSQLRAQCSPRHVPDLIQSVPDIPYTLSGKKMEVPVKKLFMGMRDSINKDAIRNPEAMDYFVKLATSFLKN